MPSPNDDRSRKMDPNQPEGQEAIANHERQVAHRDAPDTSGDTPPKPREPSDASD